MRGEPVYPVPKPQPKLLAQRAKQAERAALDKKETAKARQRGGGRCEAKVVCHPPCDHKDAETHHLKGGRGRRNKGDSILAAWKLRVCAQCHREITGHVLVPVDPKADATQIVYHRVR